MKIGIVTIVDYSNYGNRLQNYAMYYILKKFFKCKAITLTINKEKPFSNGNYLLWIKSQIVKRICYFPEYAEKRFGTIVTRWANFLSWNRKIPTKVIYNSQQLPPILNNEFDFFIAGSDQIWNYKFAYRRFNDYFLQFADRNKRVAVSASFGVGKIEDEWKKRYIDLLTSFAHISVREDAGKKIVKDLIGKEVPVLIDPVMMLNKSEWLKVSKKPRVNISNPYVLKYYLGDEKEEDKIDIWARKNGYEIYELLNKEIPELYSAGPGEFISLISNANLICSDSFHCIAFSIIFAKPFIVYSRIGSEDYMTSRLDTLLNKFGFEDRWIDMLPESKYLNCDYSNITALMKKEQAIFIQYLSRVLKNE